MGDKLKEKTNEQKGFVMLLRYFASMVHMSTRKNGPFQSIQGFQTYHLKSMIKHFHHDDSGFLKDVPTDLQTTEGFDQDENLCMTCHWLYQIET